MANITYKPTAGLTITGITPASGPKPTISITASFNGSSFSADDYFADTFTVNANTSSTAMDLGKIVTGEYLWVETDGPLTVTLTQNATPRNIEVDGVCILQSEFTALSVANGSQANAVHMSMVAAGARAPIGNQGGVY